jgi:ABC-type transporter Mla subunit MlaD
MWLCHVHRISRDPWGQCPSAAGPADGTLERLAQSGQTAFTAISSRDDALRATLQQLPSTLVQVRSAADTLGSTSVAASPVVENLAQAAHGLRPAIADLAPAAREGRSLLNELALAAPPLTGTVSRLRSASPALAQALPQVKGTLCQVNPMLVYAKPYIKDFVQFLVGFFGAANSYDRLGHLLRVTILLNRHDLVGAPPAIAAAAQELLNSGLVGQLTGATNYAPFEPPNMVGRDSSDGTPHAQGMSDYAKVFRYPHLVANCNPKG